MNDKRKPCKDCAVDHPEIVNLDPRKWRPTPYPGPRCHTHHMRFHRKQSDASHRRRTISQYGLTPGEYDRLMELQGGACAICGGKRAYRLNIDHDHSCCPGKTSCGECVRGLLCRNCNKILALLKDDAKTFRSMADYLENWPSRQLPGHKQPIVSEEQSGAAEYCYRSGCPNFVTGSSDYCSEECEQADNVFAGATITYNGPIRRVSVEDELENDRCGICGSVDHFREDCPHPAEASLQIEILEKLGRTVDPRLRKLADNGRKVH